MLTLVLPFWKRNSCVSCLHSIMLSFIQHIFTVGILRARPCVEHLVGNAMDTVPDLKEFQIN